MLLEAFSDFLVMYDDLFPSPRVLLGYTSMESQLHPFVVCAYFPGLWPFSLPDEVSLEMDFSC